MTIDLRAMEVGFELPAVEKKISDKKIYKYSNRYTGTFVDMIHIEKEAAKKFGFPDLVLQGTQAANYAHEMLFKVYREHAINDSKIQVSFIKPVLAGETLTVRGRVKEVLKEASKADITVELWSEDSAGDKTMVGEALVRV
ncbi:MAG: hypothetical protein JRI80_05600 [Deltaproteobacteria bacterium]|nr:hypothetical protein [Deltaproteobacteria bacterium]